MSSFSVPEKFKFQCFAFAGFPLDSQVPAETEVIPGLWMLRRMPFQISSHWQHDLGSLRVDYLRRADFVLCAIASSDNPDVLDHENQALAVRLNAAFYGILLQGVPYYDHAAISLAGGNPHGTPDVRQFAEVRNSYLADGMPYQRFGTSEITQAARLGAALAKVHDGGDQWQRFRRGLIALIDGLRTRHGGDKLHQFVRALEGLVKPEVARTKRQFAHRCQTFTGTSAMAKTALEQMFDIRSHVEHLHSPLEALSGETSVRIETANRRTRQAEVLARWAFMRVLESPPLLEVFEGEAGIDAFWRRLDGDRAAMWGEVRDLEAIP